MSQLIVREAARRLQVHENTIRNWVTEGLLIDIRIPGSRYIRLSENQVNMLAAAKHTEKIKEAEKGVHEACEILRETVVSAGEFLIEYDNSR